MAFKGQLSLGHGAICSLISAWLNAAPQGRRHQAAPHGLRGEALQPAARMAPNAGDQPGMEAKLDKLASIMQQFIKLCSELDSEGSGNLTYEQFEEAHRGK